MNIPTIVELDELHVISDLHLGGRAGFQIFGSTSELVWLIDQLSARARAQRVALVINGDFVDFLAETPALPFDPEGAADKLARIAIDPTFAPIFCSLRRFVATKNRFLVINLGNHDLEIALPWVREQLLEILAGRDAAARGRIVLALDGAGVRARVGAALVLCVHGNEVDTWNVADYETIRRIGRDLVQGRCVEAWIPNGGSRLVSEVMNPLKRRYPFIDLLKPEGPAVFPTLLALEPSVASQLPALVSSVARRGWDALRMATGFLGSEPPAPAEPASREAPDRGPSGPGRRALSQRREEVARELLDRIEAAWSKDVAAMDLVGADQRGEYLGLVGAFGKLVSGKGLNEALREALDGLDEDRSFEADTEDETYRDLDAMVGGDIDFLIAGHTHLERALKRRRGRGYYFNSGTWARLIQIAPALRRDPAQFSQLVDRLKAGSMERLDAAPGAEAITLRRCSVVSVWRESGETVAELRRVVAQSDQATFSCEPVAHSRFTVA